MSTQAAVAMYVDVIEFAVPIALVFGLGNFLVHLFLGAAFGGHLNLGRGDYRD